MKKDEREVLNKQIKKIKTKLAICKPVAIMWTVFVSPVTFVVGGVKSVALSVDEAKNMMDDLENRLDKFKEELDKANA